MSQLIEYARIGRMQTAAMEMAGLPLAAYAGGAPLSALPYMAALGLVVHLAGFGMNSASPTDLELDRGDPAKRDHPIVAGRVSLRAAWIFVLSMQALGVLMFVFLVAHTGAWTALWPFLGFIGLGVVYNLVGKFDKPLAVLEISGCFALLFLASGTAWAGGRATPLVWAITAFAFLLVAFQIGLAGETKELAQASEPNLLRRLGSRVVDGRLEAGDAALWFGALLSVGKAVALGLVAVAVGGVVWGALVAVVSAVAFQVYNRALLRDGPFAHDGRLRVMGIGEAGSYLLLVLALVPVLWPWLWIAFVVLPVAWFASLNRLLWARTGSAWAPGV